MTREFKIFHKIDTVHGLCEECKEETILVAIVSEYYRCTNCGHDTKQHINGRIRYLQLDESDKIRKNIVIFANMNVTVLVKDTLFKVINVVHVFVINVNVDL
jgi:uncharacterized protein (DUF983 family)